MLIHWTPLLSATPQPSNPNTPPCQNHTLTQPAVRTADRLLCHEQAVLVCAWCSFQPFQNSVLLVCISSQHYGSLIWVVSTVNHSTALTPSNLLWLKGHISVCVSHSRHRNPSCFTSEGRSVSQQCCVYSCMVNMTRQRWEMCSDPLLQQE